MICCAGDTPALSPHALRSCDRPKVLEVLENSTKIRTPISVKCLCNTRQPEHMQSFTDGLSRLGGGVMDSLFGPKNEQQETLQQEVSHVFAMLDVEGLLLEYRVYLIGILNMSTKYQVIYIPT